MGRNFGSLRASSMTALALLVAAPAWAQTAPAASPPPSTVPLKWAPFIDLDGKAGTQRNIGESDLFFPLLQNRDSMLFADLRGRFDDRSNDEGNFGIGFRHMLTAGWNFGAYGYYDRRSTALNSTFEQMTFGAEALSLDWDLRANYYQPIGPTVRNLSTSGTTTGGTSITSTAAVVGPAVDVTTTTTTTSSTITTTAQEVEQQGFDAEIGWRVPVFAPEALTQLRVYAGGYHFAGNGAGPTEGPRGRLDLTVYQVPYLWNGARLDVGGELQHDQPRGTQALAEIRLRIPLQVFGEAPPPVALTAMERRMEDPIVRDVDIVAQQHDATIAKSTATSSSLVEAATKTTSGSGFTVISSDTTTGAALPGAVAGAGANSIVLLSGTFNTTASTTLQTGQTLTGTLSVMTSSGHTATVTTAPTIAGATGGGLLNATVVMGTNSTLNAVKVSNTASANGYTTGVLMATGSTGATVSNSTITATASGANNPIGILLQTGTSANTVSGDSINAIVSGSGTGAALQSGVGASLTVTGNTLSATGSPTNNFAVSAVSSVFNAGSTGNTNAGGTCNNTLATGAIYFVDGTHCP